MKFNRFRRSIPKRKKITKDSPWRSDYEEALAEVLVNCEYEKKSLPYVIEADYNPDFTFPDKDWILIEAKGYFIDGHKEAKKYSWFVRSNPQYMIVFIFENLKKKPYATASKRVDGTFLTCGEWAAINNFLAFQGDRVPQWFIEGDFNREELVLHLEAFKEEWKRNGKKKK